MYAKIQNPESGWLVQGTMNRRCGRSIKGSRSVARGRTLGGQAFRRDWRSRGELLKPALRRKVTGSDLCYRKILAVVWQMWVKRPVRVSL